ncbi:MAG: PBP1A family penicillin-binding protein [Bdellovibrionaceae bacterium]|nr:PBP1A family penicillin-binding protein [Pseudobdellovibrionaceae bacterium]
MISSEIQQRLEKGWFKAPIEFYSAPDKYFNGKIISKESMENSLKLRGFMSKSNTHLKSNEYKWLSAEDCQMNLAEPLPDETQSCLVFRKQLPHEFQALALSKKYKILQTYSGEPLKEVSRIELAPYLFAQYYGDRPILRQILTLPDVPLYCSQAVTAIEDKKFLKHKGFSPLGFIRAIVKNLTSGYYAQGGSTITQQLVKNYFLTSDKTVKRKIKEIVMALALESQVNKEQILENYLNIIYMGQNGSFEVRGFGAAAIHYLNKYITELNLPECALLAALLNNPGRYNPYKNPEKAMERRNKVLNQMFEQNMIDQDQFAKSTQYPLPKSSERLAVTPAPYYVDAVFKQLTEMNFLPRFSEEGLKVFTYLNLDQQKWASQTLLDGVQNLEKNNAKIAKLKTQGQELQAMLIHVDLQTGGLVSLMGGKSYKISQFNRASDSLRQVGSIFKPLVYLAALESQNINGESYTPLTEISDEPYIYKYEGQIWKPQNYSGQFHGKIPLYYALKNSINVATARLGIDIGLEHIIDVARRMGVQSDLKPVPSLTLGAFEMRPLEVAKVFSGLARMGSVPELHLIQSLESLNGEIIYQAEMKSSLQVAPQKVAQLVGMLKQTIISGTARSAKKFGFHSIAAGKTGTTSDTKDAWFAGFTPSDLVVTWVGYDNNTSSGLTGASGALPIWVQYMKTVTDQTEDQDFPWPDGVSKKTLTFEDSMEWLDSPNEDERLPMELIVE